MQEILACSKLLFPSFSVSFSRATFRLVRSAWQHRATTPCLFLSRHRHLRKYHSSLVTREIRPALTVFSDEENQLRDAIAKFSKEVIKPKVKEMDEKGEPDPEVLKQLFAHGIMGIEIPQEMGGSGLDFISTCITIEEIAKVDPGIATIVDVHNTVVATVIKRCGTEEQKKKYLPKLAKETLGSFCLSEWGSGSDAFALKTTATKKGNVWILNGTKAWITNAQDANIFIVFANADPSKGYRGITAFIVERGTRGLTVGKKENKLGIRSSTTNEVHLEECVVPEENVLGEVGKGYKIAIESLNEGRIGIGAQMIGLAQGTFEATMPYLNQRKQFGQPIASFQGMQFQYATCFMGTITLPDMLYNLLWYLKKYF
jgi:alkylation response protein AidB-like acyl-CoA dehydrogenase